MDDAEHIPFVSILGPDADDVARGVPPLPDLRVVWKAKRAPDEHHGLAPPRERLDYFSAHQARPDQEAQEENDRNGKDQEFRVPDEGAGYWDDHGSVTVSDRSAVANKIPCGMNTEAMVVSRAIAPDVDAKPFGTS
jgi:hypothetical protein